MSLSKFTLERPCPECPFTRGPGAVRLTRGRVEELTANMLHPGGSQFSCHKTVEHGDDEDEEGEAIPINRSDEIHCAGALIFAEKQGAATLIMRLGKHLGIYKPGTCKGRDDVFDSADEMLKTAIR